VENSSTHKTTEIIVCVATDVTCGFVPTHSSWLNLVERSLAELTKKWLRRGTHRSTKEHVAAITD
jgi:hypothetical protein